MIAANNFNIIRIFLALIVVCNHIYSISENSYLEFLIHFCDSDFAVKCFFTISGYLVTLSFLSSISLTQYAKKRFLRIYPSYFFSIILCICIGSYFSKLSLYDFITSKETLRYIISNTTFQNYFQPTLPGVFTNHPSQAINGSLWTVKVEVMLYVSLPLLIFLFKRDGSISSSILIYGSSIVWILFFGYGYMGSYAQEIARQFPGQLCYFVIGCLYAYNNKFIENIRWWALLAAFILITFQNTTVDFIVKPLGYSLIILFLGLEKSLILPRLPIKDVSYGLYLFHFPIIQALISLRIFEISPFIGLLVTIFLTWFIASFCEKFIERPFLNKRKSQES